MFLLQKYIASESSFVCIVRVILSIVQIQHIYIICILYQENKKEEEHNRGQSASFQPLCL